MDNKAFSATTSSLSSNFILSLSPSSIISLIFEDVSIFIPFFSNAFLNVSEASLSTPGTILSIISITVTSLPKDR